MTFALTWLPDILEAAGLKVAEVPDWRSRGRGEMGAVKGVMIHHTGTALAGNMPSLNLLIKGRPDLSGPLCQLGLGRDGTFYVVAAGRANHAGKGIWQDVPKDAGNWHMIGIEVENAGGPDHTWPAVQRDACARGAAAILKHIGASSSMCCGHKEYAPKRKIDPQFDMAVFRTEVSRWLGSTTPPPLIAAADARNRPTLRRPMHGAAVESLQRAIGIDPDGKFGPNTEAVLRAWQRKQDLVPDGIAGPATWKKIDELASAPSLRETPAETLDVAVEAGGRVLGANGTALIHYFEHCARKRPDGSFTAYPDPGSRDGRPWTIGWGSTGADVAEGTVWTADECDRRFGEDIKRYEAQVAKAIDSAPTTQNQFDALVSFHYNTGAIASATLTKRHVAGDHPGAAEAFGWWTKNDGKVMRGLVLRRAAEVKLYGTPDETPYDGPP